MIHADSIHVDSDEGRYTMIVMGDDGATVIDIHDCVLELFNDMLRTVGPYAHEAESARKAVAAGMSRADYLDSPRPVRSRPVSVEDAIEAGYALDDPKSPGFHDRMVD